MFQINQPPIIYSDPWDIPLQQRIKCLSTGKYKVAYFYESANNSSFRYRVYNMVQVLNDGDNRDISASFFFLDDIHMLDVIADLADVLVICRSRYCHRINRLITKFRIRGKRILFDIDDFVFNPAYAHLIMSTLDQDNNNSQLWDYWFAYTSRMGETLRFCDGAITTNDFLADRISEFSQLPVNVVSNFINKEQSQLSQSLYLSKQASGFANDGKICLGYFSGSPSHNLDYAIITDALEIVLEHDERVELMVVGYIDAGASLNRFGKRIIRQPFHDYVNLQRLISGVEFNLMPLQSNIFTNCKSELKYFEAAVVGTLSIASPSHTYSSSIVDEKNGYIAQAHQWVSVIQRAIKNMDDYHAMAATAYADALSKYDWSTQRKAILNAIGLNK